VILSVGLTTIAFRLVASHDRDRRAVQGLGRGGEDA
jgi:heme/copper-type cytochrome/quinol oxidase subunit 4